MVFVNLYDLLKQMIDFNPQQQQRDRLSPCSRKFCCCKIRHCFSSAPENSAAARSDTAFLLLRRLSPCSRKFCCCKIRHCFSSAATAIALLPKILLLQDQTLLFFCCDGYRLAPENSAAARSDTAFLLLRRLSPCSRKFCCCKIRHCFSSAATAIALLPKIL